MGNFWLNAFALEVKQQRPRSQKTYFKVTNPMSGKWKLLSYVRLFATHGLYSPWNSQGQNTGVGSCSLLQGIFPTQGSNPVLHCRWILFFFFPFIFISWRLITLQYCSGFCHTLSWISRGFTCIPHPDPPSHLPLHLIPLGLPSAPGPSTCLMHPTWAGDLFHPR